jgi:hypothetical protein
MNIDPDTPSLRSSKPYTVCCGHDMIDIQGRFSYTSFHKESSYQELVGLSAGTGWNVIGAKMLHRK